MLGDAIEYALLTTIHYQGVWKSSHGEGCGLFGILWKMDRKDVILAEHC